MKKLLFLSLITIASIVKPDASQFSQAKQEAIYKVLAKYTCFNAKSCKEKQNVLTHENFKKELENKEGLGGLVENLKKGALNLLSSFKFFLWDIRYI